MNQNVNQIRQAARKPQDAREAPPSGVLPARFALTSSRYLPRPDRRPGAPRGEGAGDTGLGRVAEKHGRYRVTRLIEMFGPDLRLVDLRRRLPAEPVLAGSSERA